VKRRRGSHSKSNYVVGYFFDSQIIDRDFDDDELDLVALRDRITAGKAVALHPDGDRRDTMDDPVPLHSHVPNGGSYAEFPSVYLILKEAKAQREADRARDIEREKRRKEVEQITTTQVEERKHKPWKPPQWVPKPFDPREYDWTPEQAMLNNMRLNDPLAPGIARVWQGYVMINEGDTKNATLANHDVPWREVWRGRGKIIYERSISYGWVG
jgi:hypothetical protein